MTFEEFDQASNNWSNEEYFDYMKESGYWTAHENLGLTGKPCDRCEYDELESWRVEAYIDVYENGSPLYIAGTEFEICLMCMIELHGAARLRKQSHTKGTPCRN